MRLAVTFKTLASFQEMLLLDPLPGRLSMRMTASPSAFPSSSHKYFEMGMRVSLGTAACCFRGGAGVGFAGVVVVVVVVSADTGTPFLLNKRGVSIW